MVTGKREREDWIQINNTPLKNWPCVTSCLWCSGLMNIYYFTHCLGEKSGFLHFQKALVQREKKKFFRNCSWLLILFFPSNNCLVNWTQYSLIFHNVLCFCIKLYLHILLPTLVKFFDLRHLSILLIIMTLLLQIIICVVLLKLICYRPKCERFGCRDKNFFFSWEHIQTCRMLAQEQARGLYWKNDIF